MFLNYNGDQRVPNIFTKNTAAVHEEPSEVSCDLHNGGDDDTEVIALIDDLDYGVDSDSLSSSQQSNYSLSSAGSDDSNQPSSNGLLLRHSDDGLSFAHPTSFEEVMTFSTRSVDSLTTSSRLHRHPRKRRSAPNYYRLNPQPRRIGVTPRTSTLSADARSSSSMWKRKRA
ncbi:unnamed protein product, partial [Anisakis simplex]|uniref:Suppressor protein SRP40-like n=1 Tax=Anisakis simplex TaxID=6269 RepID=A0A0M3JMC3_ANISI